MASVVEWKSQSQKYVHMDKPVPMGQAFELPVQGMPRVL